MLLKPELSQSLVTVLLSLMVLLALGVTSASSEPLEIKDRVVLTKASPGCVRREEFDRLVELAARHDENAFAEYMLGHECPVLKVGTTATYQDSGFSGRAMCVLPTGRADCLWIPSAAAQKANGTKRGTLRHRATVEQ
jgi:hypothetical protein